MAKLTTQVIGEKEIVDFANQSSDFAFELKVLSALNELGVLCEHGGTYEDPATQKPRQFDIRGLIDFGVYRVRMAVECKNIRENYPLVVFEMPRVQQESFHEIIKTHTPKRSSILIEDFGKNYRIRNAKSLYNEGDYVGKSCTQVGTTLINGSTIVTGSDADVYDRYAQAIQSAHELVEFSIDDWKWNSFMECETIVIPILVVPNDRLWVLRHDGKGSQTGAPLQVDRSSIYIDKYVQSTNKMNGISCTLSHLEIFTLRGLAQFVPQFGEDHFREKHFLR